MKNRLSNYCFLYYKSECKKCQGRAGRQCRQPFFYSCRRTMLLFRAAGCGDFCSAIEGAGYRFRIMRRAPPHCSFLAILNSSAQRTPQLLTSHSYLLTIFQIRPRSGHRIFSLLTPISSLYFKFVRAADTASSHFSLLSPHFIDTCAKRIPQFLISNFSFLIIICAGSCIAIFVKKWYNKGTILSKEPFLW